MSDRSKKFPPAFKHGGYARTILFPGEDQAAYKRLYDGIVAEFAPVGPVEEDIVKELADNAGESKTFAFFAWRSWRGINTTHFLITVGLNHSPCLCQLGESRRTRAAQSKFER